MKFDPILAVPRLLAVCAVLALVGCKTTEVRPIAPIPLSDPVMIQVDGERVALHHPYLDEGELVGWERRTRSDSSLVRVPYEQEFIVLDENRTLFAAVGGLVIALALVAVF
jgi:hypothetical protein